MPRRPGDRYRMLPSPNQVPIWVGGSSEARSGGRRSWVTGGCRSSSTPTEYGCALDRLAKEVDRAGRPAGSVTPAMVLFVSLDDDQA